MNKSYAPVLLYQMGKVGSSTLEFSLKSIGIPTLHIHRYFFDSYETKGHFLHYYFKRVKQRVIFDYYLKYNNVKIITLYRDPLSRNISSFFQNIEEYFSNNELKNLTFQILRDKFNTLDNIHTTPDSWFKTEFLRKTGINIFDFPFDKKKGYMTIKYNKIHYFVCTLESMNSLEEEISFFINHKKFKLINANVGEKKWYANLYAEFKHRYSPDKKMLDDLYDSKTTKYFYTEDMILKFKSQWN